MSHIRSIAPLVAQSGDGRNRVTRGKNWLTTAELSMTATFSGEEDEI